MTSNYHSDSTHKENSMVFHGQGLVTTFPDIAIIRLGVQTIGENLTSIQNENAQITEEIINAISQMGVNDIQTYQYNIERFFDYVDGTRIDRGYSVRNILQIRLSNLELVGTIIDVAVEHGANIVDFISFEVSEPEAVYKQALNLAVMDAFQKAKSISMNLGIFIDPIPFRIIENTTTPLASSQVRMLRERAYATPIEPGNIRIDASVTVEFTY